MPVLHPAYEEIAQVERAWAADADQAHARACLLVRHLADCGLLGGGEWQDGYYVVPYAGDDGEDAGSTAPMQQAEAEYF